MSRELGQVENDLWISLPCEVPSLLTVRSAGDMTRDSADRLALYRAIGVEPHGVFVVDQVHSRTVITVEVDRDHATTGLGERLLGTGDGMIAPPGEILLAVTVADCMPILLCDKSSGAHGLLHSGWKGTGILAEAISAMSDAYGTTPRDLSVTLGPCIGAEAYEVDSERAAAFSREWGERAIRQSDDRWYLDMRAANCVIAERFGVGDLVVVDACTYTDTRLGSFRREGADRFGRMLALTGTGLERK